MKDKSVHLSARDPIQLIAHIQNVGDVPSGLGGWAGERGSKRAIEGLLIPSVPYPELSDLTYQAFFQDGSLSQSASVGAFCGTKGLAKPILGLRILQGANSSRCFEVMCEACFADGSQAGPVTAGVLCKADSGAPMEAFRLTVQAFAPAGDAQPKNPAVRETASQARAPSLDHAGQMHDGNADLRDLAPRHNGVNFLTPTDLSVSQLAVRRVALIGSCFVESWQFPQRLGKNCAFDVFVINHAGSPPDPPPGGVAVSDYDFQIIQIPLRSILQDAVMWKIPYSNLAAYQEALKVALRNLEFHVQSRMLWNVKYGLLTFMTNFFVPQRHMVGSLLPRYDIRNIEHFVYLLNEKLEALVRGYSNAYILDVDRISASFGRRYIQDDSVYAVNHGSILGTPGIDASRIEPMAPMADHYEIRWFPVLSDAIWAEALSMHRIARQRDAVKLVITDLDDTLWSGVSGDMDDLAKVLDPVWVLGLIETLMVLKQRGILLAIASKNDEKRIREIWPKIFGNRLSLEDFAAIRINWRPKAENIQEMLSVLNLLPGSAVFIDDNPAERAAVQQAFPNMRVLGRYPYYLRRILLWSSETQVASISEESRRRTEMAQTQFLREASRERMSRGDFLAQASPKVEIAWLTGVGDPRFARAFELINKTNQFNTTGHRWKHEDMARFLGGGGRALIFNVQDAFTNYGLVGVVLVKDAVIEQWVMSCRVIGYDIEQAVMSVIVQALRGANAIAVTGVLVETEANLACRSLFENAHFRRMQTGWVLEASELLTIPSHITLVQTP